MGFSFQGIHSKEKKLKARITGYPMLPAFRNNTESIPGHGLLQLLGHPYDTGYAALSLHKLLGSNEVFAVAHKAGSLNSAAGHGSQLGEGHADGGHACVLTVRDAHTVGEGLDTADTLKASAAGHGLLNDGIQGYIVQSALGELTNGIVYVLILTDSLVDYFFLSDHLAGTLGIQLVGRLGIQP